MRYQLAQAFRFTLLADRTDRADLPRCCHGPSANSCSPGPPTEACWKWMGRSWVLPCSARISASRNFSTLGRRLPATMDTTPTLSSGSNLGPTNQKLVDRVKADIAKFRKENPSYQGPIPADLLTTSASGLDPDISPASAFVQARACCRGPRHYA